MAIQVVQDSLDYFCQLIDVFAKITGENIYDKMNRIGIGVSRHDLLLANCSFIGTLTPQKQSKMKLVTDISVVKQLLNDIMLQGSVSVNHLGIGYYTDSIATETSRLGKLTDGLLYEESSGMNTKWLFTGDVKKTDAPLFEFVLKEAKQPVLSSWTPHLQFDFDTTLSIDNLENVLSKHFGVDWIKWRLESPQWGTPLVMGRLYSVGGIKIYLGIGTTDRNRDWHRNQGLVRI
jgi:hypothetical protein